MKSMETKIRIEASPENVWSVLIDLEKHQEWNPFLISIKGEAKVGSILTNKMQSTEKKTMEFKPEVLVVDENREFRWAGKLFVKGLFDGEHYFILHDNGDGSTNLEHGEKFSGLLSGTLLKMIGADTLNSFENMNRALKQRVESMGEEVRNAG